MLSGEFHDPVRGCAGGNIVSHEDTMCHFYWCSLKSVQGFLPHPGIGKDNIALTANKTGACVL